MYQVKKKVYEASTFYYQIPGNILKLLHLQKKKILGTKRSSRGVQKNNHSLCLTTCSEK